MSRLDAAMLHISRDRQLFLDNMRKASLYASQFTTEDGAASSIDPQVDRAQRWRKWE